MYLTLYQSKILILNDCLCKCKEHHDFLIATGRKNKFKKIIHLGIRQTLHFYLSDVPRSK